MYVGAWFFYTDTSMRARSTQLDQAPVSIEVKADFALR